MDAADFDFLERLLVNFIGASINRHANSGEFTFRYRVAASELKSATNRTRLHQSVIDDYKAFFEGRQISVVYDEQFSVFHLTVDLNRVVLDSQQACDLATAMENYRAFNA